MIGRVVNVRWQRCDVYVGRPSKWGNPFSHLPSTLAEFRVATRAEAVASHAAWILEQPALMADLHELEGRVLGCWCAPLPCHAETLVSLAERNSRARPRVVSAMALDGRARQGRESNVPVSSPCPTSTSESKKEIPMYNQNDPFASPRPTSQPRDPFIGEGEHVLLILSTDPFTHNGGNGKPAKGPAIRITFETLQSNTLAVGSRSVQNYFYTQPARFQGKPSDADRYAALVCAAKGVPEGSNVSKECWDVLQHKVQYQILRGVVVRCRGLDEAGKAAKARGEKFVVAYWSSVPQTEQDVAARRQQADAKLAGQPLQAPGGQDQQAPQQYAPPTAPAAPPAAPQWGAPAAPPAAAPAAPGAPPPWGR